MVKFCKEIQETPKVDQLYQRRVKQIVKWYKDNHEKYSARLKIEAGISGALLDTLEDRSDAILDLLDIRDLSYSFDAKLAYFVVSDTLIKLILSMYSQGLDTGFKDKYGISTDETCSNWMECKSKSFIMTELLARVLLVEKEENSNLEFQFDLMSLQVDRKGRNTITHSGSYSRCMSAIRSYNTIRSMLIFMDEANNDLPVFEYANQFDLNDFLVSPCDFDFDNYTTILVAGSVHDVPVYQRSAVANLPWDMVVDLDGYSDCGGLLGAVTHNQIRKQVLDLNAARQAQSLIRGKTMWYRCGNYQDYTIKADKISVGGYTAFCPGTRPPVEEVVSCILTRANDLNRPLNIVILNDRPDFTKAMLKVLFDEDPMGNSFFVTWIGLSNQDGRDVYSDMSDYDDDDEDTLNRVYRYFQAPMAHFYEAIEGARLWKPRESVESNFCLYGVEGPVQISENMRNNLEPYLEVLYEGCENVSPEIVQEETTAFLHGHTASWSVIANGTAVPLKTLPEMKTITDYIRTILGATQTEPGKRFVFVKHSSGIGGTTLARQIAWEMHKLKYPVLSVKSFDSYRVPGMLEELYDHILGTKPFVLLIEDTHRDRDKLFEYVKRINRRCVVICAVREKANIQLDGAKYINLTMLTAEQVEQIRRLYRTAKSGDEVGVNLFREQRIDAELTEKKMRTPFIIGLYYMEKDFCVTEYVKKAFKSCTIEQRDLLALLAMCDDYGKKYVPVSYVNDALRYDAKTLFLKSVPAADSLVCRGLHDGIDVYYFKHSLLSEYYLQEYSGGEEASRRAYLAKMFINTVADVGKLNVYHVELLIYILIQNRAYKEDFSQLMMDFRSESEQRTVMHLLIEKFEKYAKEALSSVSSIKNRAIMVGERDLNQVVLKLIAHAYAHLGRMYSRHSIHNYPQAAVYFRQALDYLRDNDASIYHMYGTGILDKLKSGWDNAVAGEKPSDELRAAYRLEIDEAAKYFDLTCKHNKPDYGYPSKLELYYLYLIYIYKVYEVHNNEELNRIPPEERMLQGEFVRNLEEAQNMAHFDNFNSEAVEKINRFDGLFRSDILYGDYQKTVEFYEEQARKNTGNADRLRPVLRSLLFAKINMYRAKLPEGDFPYGMSEEDGRSLFATVEQLLNESMGIPESYTEYRGISTLFRYWFQFAKLTEQPVDRGHSMALRWVDIEESFNPDSKYQNPEPFYHLMTMKLLSIVDNPLAQSEIRAVRELESQLSRTESLQKGTRYKIRDVFVYGSGMGRLLDVSRQGKQDEIVSFLAHMIHDLEKSRPNPVEGKIIGVPSHATLELYKPATWESLRVSLRVGKNSKNSFSSNQINSNVRFLLGFGFDGMEAISSTARDVANEKFDLDKILSKDNVVHKESRNVTYTHRRPTANQVAMYPKRGVQNLVFNKNGSIKALYGTYRIYGDQEEYEAILDVSDIERFDAQVQADYGGADKIMELIQKLETIPCIPNEEKSAEGEPVQVSVYNTWRPLHELLGQPPAQQAKPTQVKTVNSAKVGASGIPIMTAVQVLIESPRNASPTGKFTYQRKEYQARITTKISSKLRKRLEAAAANGERVNASVIGAPDKNGVYPVKLN